MSEQNYNQSTTEPQPDDSRSVFEPPEVIEMDNLSIEMGSPSGKRLIIKQRNYPKHILPSAMVKEFMETFGQPVKSNPEFPSRNIAWMRLKLILEETWELMVAMYRRDMVGIADALGDLVYVVVGMAHTYGIPFDAVIREIHRSNMAKAGPDGKAILRADGKIQKPEGWTPPDLRKVMGL